MLSGRVANIAPVDGIDRVRAAVNSYTRTIGIYPESLKRELRNTLPLSGAQRLTSLGYALQRRGRHAPGRPRADPADLQMDHRRRMRPERGHPAVATGAGMTERLTALQVVEGIEKSGKACVVTGASSGLGRESARALAAAGAHVVLAARNRDALAQTAQWIAGEVPGARISTVPLDLTALAGVRAAAEAIRDIAPAIDVLMNNAGVMFTPFGRTRDGFETQIGTNHFGHFELTRLLSSGGHIMGDVDFDDPNWEAREYDKFVAYGASKTANILHTMEADRRLRVLGICAYAVHPGTVATSLARYLSGADFSALRKMVAATAAARGEPTDGFLDFATPEQGAATQVWAAVSPELADRGALYLEDCGVSDAVAPYARDERRAADWWALSEKLCDRS